MSRLVSFGVLVGILVVLGVVFYQVIASFLLPLFLATLLVVIFQPMHRWMLQRLRGPAWLAALLTTFAVMAIVLLPSISVCVFALIEAKSALMEINIRTSRERLIKTRAGLGLEIPHAEQWRQIQTKLANAILAGGDTAALAPPPVPPETINSFDALVRMLDQEQMTYDPAQAERARAALADIQQKKVGTIDYDGAVQLALREFREFKQQIFGGPLALTVKELANPSDEQLRAVMIGGLNYGRERLVALAGDITALAVKTVIGLVIMVVAMFFFFYDGRRMVEHVMRLTPLDRDYERELLAEFDRVSRAVVVATLLSAVVQGALAGIGYALAGLESVFLLMLLTTLLAMVPLVGTSLVWLPASLWLYIYEDRPVAGIVLALYGAIVVSQIDNVIKPWVLHGQSKLHPLAALLSVLGGVGALGPIGILVGPMVFVFLATLLKIMQRELLGMERWPWSSNGADPKIESQASRPPRYTSGMPTTVSVISRRAPAAR